MNVQVARMFDRTEAFDGTKDIAKADIVVFTGGADISPDLYNEKRILAVKYIDPERDQRDIWAYKNSVGKLRIGICRGAQFLNVMAGGSLWQDVTNHRVSHPIRDLMTGKSIRATSTHHQMMRVNIKTARIIATANESRYKANAVVTWYKTAKYSPEEVDPEVVWYENDSSLCFQPHPEIPGYDELTKYFFSQLEIAWINHKKRLYNGT